MIVDEFIVALQELSGEGKGEEPVCIEVDGKQLFLNSVTVVVNSDIWVPETVVVTGVPIIEGEADDG